MYTLPLQNYGDESDAYGLMYPSIYSNNGVYEEDFFKPRPPEVIKQIFENIGVSMSPEVFQELWKEAVRRDPKGQVRRTCIHVGGGTILEIEIMFFRCNL